VSDGTPTRARARGGSLREHRATVLVAALSAALGTLLLEVTGALGTVVDASPLGDFGTVRLALLIVSGTFLTIAVYVAAVVTSNTVATLIAGRRRLIALYRLIGSTASAQRTAIAREGLAAGAVGALIGVVAGVALSAALVGVAVLTDVIPALDYQYARPELLLPAAIVILTTWLASWIGARRVLDVTPLEATGGAVEPTVAGSPRGRIVGAIVLEAIGCGLLTLGIAVGLALGPLGLVIALPGGILSFTGIVVGAPIVLPPALRLAGRLLGRSAAARIAAANAVRNPERSARSTIGLVIGVTLVTTFVVATECFRTIILQAQAQSAESYAGVQQVLDAIMAVFLVLIGFSAVIAAVGMVNSLSLSVLQRRRELGLLRVLGFTAREVRLMVLAEAAQLAVTSIVLGLLLGTVYGWAGAQSLLGGIGLSPTAIAPAVPWQLLAGAAVVATALTLLASVAPARRATRVSPITALAVE
jgi:putative ABC transport system permease protein